MIKGVGPPLATCCPRLPERGGGGGGEVEKGGEEGGEGAGEGGGGGGGVSTQQPPSNHPSLSLCLLQGGAGAGATPIPFNPLLPSHTLPGPSNSL